MLNFALSTLAIAPVAFAATYPLKESWSGQNFFNGWNPDPSTYDNTTNGDVFWGTPANNASMYYVTNSGTVIMKVDNTSSVVYNQKRYAPKLLSKTSYGIGTVWVMDAVHVPYGCSVWPSFWTQGANWPAGGEIDILEGINLQVGNQVAIHAAGTCNVTPLGSISGTIGNTNCTGGYGATGCTVKDNVSNSYGSAFAAAGGGVYVAELASTGISVWFLTRSAVPSSLTSSASSIDTSTLGTPVASFASSSCNIANQFTAQTMTLSTTLCGDWAGTLINETCPVTYPNTCYTSYVINNQASTLANAYFEINYVNVYSSASATTGSASTNTSTTSGTRTSGSASSGASGSAATSSKAAGSPVKDISLGMGALSGLTLSAVGLVGGVFMLL